MFVHIKISLLTYDMSLQPKDFGEISLRDIDQIARSSFPLCMRYLFEKVNSGSVIVKILLFLGVLTFATPVV